MLLISSPRALATASIADMFETFSITKGQYC